MLRQALHELNIPVCVQVGASLDFVAGRIRRAPRQLQKLGLEWALDCRPRTCQLEAEPPRRYRASQCFQRGLKCEERGLAHARS